MLFICQSGKNGALIPPLSRLTSFYLFKMSMFFHFPYNPVTLIAIRGVSHALLPCGKDEHYRKTKVNKTGNEVIVPTSAAVSGL